jgi:YbbR domain-containing protein
VKRGTGREWKNWIFENGSYKLVALFVTLILWVTILGRRDFVLSKDMDIEFLLPRSIAVASNVDRRVTVKVSGPRMALKKFAQNPGTITVDLGKAQLGQVRAVISARAVDVPFGVKVLSVTPDVLNVNLVPSTVDDQHPDLQPDQQPGGK